MTMSPMNIQDLKMLSNVNRFNECDFFYQFFQNNSELLDWTLDSPRDGWWSFPGSDCRDSGPELLSGGSGK